ncbi:MAG: hypothetical protein ACJAT7_002793 [Psychromonas sp.]|jgi:hypothetical protein
MRNKQKRLRNNQVWFSVWNAKTANHSTKCDATYHPTRVSNK